LYNNVELNLLILHYLAVDLEEVYLTLFIDFMEYFLDNAICYILLNGDDKKGNDPEV